MNKKETTSGVSKKTGNDKKLGNLILDVGIIYPTDKDMGMPPNAKGELSADRGGFMVIPLEGNEITKSTKKAERSEEHSR